MMRQHILIAMIFALLCGSIYAQEQRPPLNQALDYDTNLLLVSNLRPNAQQVVALYTAAGSVGRLVSAAEAAQAAAREQARALLAAERKALAEGTELTAEQSAGLQALRDAQAARRQQMHSGADNEIRRLRQALSPQQAALVDWTVPPDAMAAPDDTAALEEMRLLAARLGEAERFFERMRYVIPTQYIQTRVAGIGAYLRQYVRPNTREYADAESAVMRMLDEARMVNENEWPQQAPLFASQLLQRLNLLDAPAPGAQAGGTRYNWWDIYYLLSDPQTPGMMQAIRAGMGGAAQQNNQDQGNEGQQ